MGRAIPLSGSFGPCVFDGAMLAGDAAGLVNPLTGEGIDYAMESGELAGEVAVDALRGEDVSAISLAGYQRLCEATFGSVLRLNGWVRALFSVPWVLDQLFRAARRALRVRNQVAEIALGATHARITARIVCAALAGC